MKKKKLLLVFLIVIFLLAGIAVLFFSGIVKPRGARVLFESTPAALVYVNGEQVGRTPLERDFSVAEITVKLVPDSQDEPLALYETRVLLTSGVKTVVRRQFGTTRETSAGEVISFEKTSEEPAIISVISSPDGAQIKLDGQVRGVTPIKISDVAAGVHQITLSAPGYAERNFSVQTTPGYRLTAVAQLAYTGERETQLTQSTPQPDASPTPVPTLVQILNTPTGFLRVRNEPSSTALEIGRVDPGKTYKYLDTDSAKEWIKLELEDGKIGWVSAEYATTSAKSSE